VRTVLIIAVVVSLSGCSQAPKDELADAAKACGVPVAQLRRAYANAERSAVGRRVPVGPCWTEKQKSGEVFIVASLDGERGDRAA